MSVQDDHLNFLSTQMQSAYEDSEIKKHHEDITEERISQLQQFKAQQQKIKPIERKIVKTTKKPKRRSGKRIKTLTSHVDEMFGTNSRETSPDTQLSIVEYFSGKKRKVKEILDKLESNKFHTQDHNDMKFKGYNCKLPYNKEEWENIIKAIKENLPNLSNSATKSLKSITERIEFENSQKSTGLWDKASRQPSEAFNDSDLKLLYDLNSDQMGLDLTQNDIEEDNEIPDSSSEPELLEYNILGHTKPVSKINVPQSFNTFPPAFGENKEKEIIICSSSDNSPIKSNFSTPKKLRPQQFETPIRKVSQPTNKSPQFTSQINLTPPNFSLNFDTQQSIYATASSQFYNASPQYKTKVIELKGDLKIIDRDTKNFKIKKIGGRSEPRDKEIIGDSEDDDDNEISIIEISTLVNDDTDFNEYNDSMVQVPSSPGMEMPKTIMSIRSTAEEAVDDFSQLSNTQLRDTFKHLGIKPVKSKNAMIEILKNMDDFIGEDSKSLSQVEFKDQLFKRFKDVIRSDDFWYEKVITYEPISIIEMKEWLNSHNFNIEIDLLEKFCDNQGICTTNQEQTKQKLI
ncbi:structure-specific endonuclease subunit Slx4p [[Candida] jaroonii]|uniref:Structure-specific endonuclease subunit Slx4p n=1 Tax=[Candida] jaroonii TaxID=467808 RepID=A0ACA9YC66_9ASCO|nr:structure-specific endonuclease subunit Slx4p [[Candida] jaroonii]